MEKKLWLARGHKHSDEAAEKRSPSEKREVYDTSRSVIFVSIPISFSRGFNLAGQIGDGEVRSLFLSPIPHRRALVPANFFPSLVRCCCSLAQPVHSGFLSSFFCYTLPSRQLAVFLPPRDSCNPIKLPRLPAALTACTRLSLSLPFNIYAHSTETTTSLCCARQSRENFQFLHLQTTPALSRAAGLIRIFENVRNVSFRCRRGLLKARKKKEKRSGLSLTRRAGQRPSAAV